MSVVAPKVMMAPSSMRRRSLFPNMLNTLCMIVVAVVVVLILSAMGGFVFGTKKFPGKNFLYMAIMILMMIPGSSRA